MSDRPLRKTRVGLASPLANRKCVLCRKPVRPGQDIKYRRNSLDEAPAYEHYLVMHEVCTSKPVNKSLKKAVEFDYHQAQKRFAEMDEQWANLLN